MSDENTLTPEDGEEFANLLGINGDNNESDVEESSETIETDDEEVEAPESYDEPDNSEEEEEATQKSTETPKKKSWIAKVLSERNQLRARVAELESKIRNNEHTTDEFLEYTDTVSKKNTHESQEVQSLLTQYPDSAKFIKQLDTYADTTGDLESAYKAYLAVNDPELYVKTFVSKQKQAQINSGKLSPAGVAVPRVTEKKVSDTIEKDDADALRKAFGL